MRVELLIAGSTHQWGPLAGAGPGRVEFPALVACLRWPDGPVALFDTGYAADAKVAMGRWPERAYRSLLPISIGPGQHAAAQLATLGVTAKEVSHIVISHFHADHIGGLRDFPNARLIHGRARAPRPAPRASLAQTRHGFIPQFLPIDFERRAGRHTDLDPVPIEELGDIGQLFGPGRDLLGDRSAIIIPLPGHEPGHLGLWLPGQQLLLAGDAIWAPIDAGGLPPRAVQEMVFAQPGAYRNTAARLRELARRQPGISIVASHSRQLIELAQARLAP
ncbi:MAG: MBL fold metallo-hydrolase [Brooklawnia sp.]|jgi:glyoxylase-like metal-dependent hydrolase (beta-lactamase superfamily II)